MAKQALLVIDMINAFAHPSGSLYSESVAAIIPEVVKEIEAARRRGDIVIHVTDWHLPNDLEFERFPPHAVQHTQDAEPLFEVTPAAEDYRVLKQRYSGFYNTDLDDILESNGIGKLRVVGNCTNICVLYTIADARNRDYPVDVVTRAVASFDTRAHDFILTEIDNTLKASLV